MATENRPATGPALMERLVQLEAKFDAFALEARRHWANDEQRMKLIDRFIDPQLALDSLLKQTFAALERNYKAVQALERSQRDEHAATRSAVALHLSEPGQARERN